MNFLRRHVRLIAVLYWIIIFTGTHIPAERIVDVGRSDKLIHLGMFAGLGMLLFLAMHISNPRRRFILLPILFVGGFYAVFDELTQPLFGRSCDGRDMLADLAGLCVSIGLCGVIFRKARDESARAAVVTPPAGPR